MNHDRIGLSAYEVPYCFVSMHAMYGMVHLRMQVREQNNQFVSNPSDNQKTNSIPTFPTTTRNFPASPFIIDRRKP